MSDVGDRPFQMALNVGVWAPGWDVRQAPPLLERAAELGYTHVVVPVRAIDDPDAVAALLSRHGLAPLASGSAQPDVDISSDDADVRAAGSARLVEMIAIARDVGADQLGGVLYGPLGGRGPVTRERFERTAALLGAAAEHAHGQGVQLAFEVLNRYETAIVNTVEQGLALIAASGSEHLRLHLDTFHMNIEESDLVAATVAAVPHLAYLELEQSNRGAFDQGTIPLRAIVEAAVAAGYRGKFGMEAFSAALMPAETAAKLAVWREVFGGDNTIAEDAIALVREAHRSVT
jgi:D-psicose/D-tagatose/L-ribulose 3-epimerase